MEVFTLEWAAARMRASIVGAHAMDITGICTDSRKAAPGSLFFALKGEHADGHVYVPQALSRGAVAVVAAESGTGSVTTDSIQLVVEDPLRALGDLAREYRGLFAVKVVGITGSIGKTSTKEMTAHILRGNFCVHANEKNYNNEIGVPLTLFGLNRMHEVAVVEMGMRAAGEIRSLAEIARPTIAIITNIGMAHVEMLGSQKAIAETKAEILELLPSDGVAILPEDLPYSDLVLKMLPAGCRVLRVGNRGADIWAEPCTMASDNGGTAFRVHNLAGQSAAIALKTPGVHHISNALFAMAAACELGLPLDQAAASLETWTGADGRMTVKQGLEDVTVLDDCYNAGPESMKAALDTIQNFKGSRVAILGDMRELGEHAPELHETVGRHAADTDLRLLVTIGPLAGLIADSMLKELKSSNNHGQLEVVKFDCTTDCEESIGELVRPGDIVLVKGSRAMRMEQIVARLVGEQVSDPHG